MAFALDTRIAGGNLHKIRQRVSELFDAVETYVNTLSVVGHSHTLSDVTDSGGLAALDTAGTSELDNNAVTYAKFQDIGTQTILGRSTAGTGDPEALTPSQVLTLLNVESGADVTDSANVSSAGAVMNTGNEDVGGIKNFTSGIKQTLGAEQGLISFISGDDWTFDPGGGYKTLVHVGASNEWQVGGSRVLDSSDLHSYDPTPDSDHSFSGHPGWEMVAGESLVFGDLCYFGASSRMWKADADALASMPGVFVCAESTLSAAATGTFIPPGCFIRDDTWAWTVGAKLYASTTAGDFTETVPSGSGDVPQVVGFASTADIIYFYPSQNWIVV